METVTLSKQELEQIQVFEDLKEKKLKQRAAARKLGLSVRQVQRKLKDYRRAGPASLAHGARGKPSRLTWAIQMMSESPNTPEP